MAAVRGPPSDVSPATACTPLSLQQHYMRCIAPCQALLTRARCMCILKSTDRLLSRIALHIRCRGCAPHPGNLWERIDAQSVCGRGPGSRPDMKSSGPSPKETAS